MSPFFVVIEFSKKPCDRRKKKKKMDGGIKQNKGCRKRYS